MGKTKRGSASRFGARYGLKLKKKVADIEKKQYKKHICPFCKKKKVKRLASGIWYCKKCDKKFAGDAYKPGIN